MEETECPICYDKMILRENNIYGTEENNNLLNDDTVIQLNCGHQFHYKCILMTFKTMLKKHNSKKSRKCPYCRCDGGYLPIEKNKFPIKNINREYKLIQDYIYADKLDKVYEIAKQNNFLNEHKCQALLTTGPNKGIQCKKNKKNGSEYCCIHIKKMNIFDIKDVQLCIKSK
jgi:hypothetical protein